MPRPARPYLVIAGPTAVGKSGVALELAERLDGEIVAADSRQVYRGLDVATVKPGPAERARIPHHLLDRVDPGVPYSAADYAREARAAIAAVEARGRTAIVCGGTGFYLEALAGSLDALEEEEGGPDRAAARARVAAVPPDRRHDALAAVDPDLAAALHPHDRQRVARGLEVWFRTGRALSALQAGGGPRLLHLAVRLTRPRPELYARIESRLAEMLEAGLEGEAWRLWEAGLSPDHPGVDTIGIQEWWPTFEGRRVRDATVREILQATRRYAKRQETWFRRQGDYRPVPAAGAAAAVAALWSGRSRRSR